MYILIKAKIDFSILILKKIKNFEDKNGYPILLFEKYSNINSNY
ncbi:hypothetical protein UT300001_00430 [Clostridium sp. CTA-1]